MEKTETEKQFDVLVSHIFTFFKPLGYKRKGKNFRFYNHEGEFGKIINFQKSQWGNKTDIRFTVNIGVYLADYEYYTWNKKSGEKFIEPVCAVRSRLSESWYDLNEDTNIEDLKEKLERNFTKTISYFNKIKTREDVVNQLIIDGGYDFGFFAIGKIKTLFYNGQKDRAMSLLERAMRMSDESFKPTLENIRQELVNL